MAISFNKNETKGILKVLIDLMKADGKIEKHEVDFLSQMTGVLKVDAVLLKEADMLTFDNAVSIIKNMNDDQKQVVYHLMVKMVNPTEGNSDVENKMLFKVVIDADIKLPTFGLKK